MRELKDTLERAAWLATRKRIGFIGGADSLGLQRDIWTMELYRRDDGGYSIEITSDSDESCFVCDFEDIQ